MDADLIGFQVNNGLEPNCHVFEIVHAIAWCQIWHWNTHALFKNMLISHSICWLMDILKLQAKLYKSLKMFECVCKIMDLVILICAIFLLSNTHGIRLFVKGKLVLFCCSYLKGTSIVKYCNSPQLPKSLKEWCNSWPYPTKTILYVLVGYDQE